jgi:squalene-associated FAD-dependent desaturase
MKTKSVTVVGGGIAGLSAAVSLAQAGCTVTVLEKRPVAGGRASSFQDGEGWVDNCQHVLLGCCTQLLKYYRMVAVEKQIRFHDTLYFRAPNGVHFTLKAGSWPAPFHLASGLLQYRALPFRRRLGIMRTLARIRRQDPPANSFESWLRAQGETEESLALFWEPVVVSALNASLDRVASGHGFHLFKVAFFSNRSGYRIGIPRIPLAELYTGPAADFLERRSGRLLLGVPVDRFLVGAAGIEAARAREGRFRSDYYVSALPPKRLLKLLPDEWRDSSWAAPLKQIEYSPILSAHFWLRDVSFNLPFLAVLGRNIQWVFNRTRLLEDAGGGVLHLEAVISAETRLSRLSREAVLQVLWEEIKQIAGIADDRSLLRWRIIREREATFVPDVRSLSLRPESVTPLDNLFLAGDWVRTGWPATMESAAISGFQAADAILERIRRQVPGSPI